MGDLILPLFAAALFAVPLFLVMAFVTMRAKKRREALAGPWSALAAQYGGQMQGSRVFVSRGAYQMTLDMRLVSAIEGVRNVYYGDGGTFTEARVAFDPTGPTRVATVGNAPLKLSVAEVPRVFPGGSPLAHLPTDARVFLGEREARVVFPGAVGDAQAIGAAFAGLSAIAEQVTAHGPIAVTSAG